MIFACIIPAAGEGSRIGRCKAALPFAYGETLLSHLISAYINSFVNNIFVITGDWKEETIMATQSFSSMVSFINNDNPKMGMFSSVCKGISHLDNDAKYFFVQPVDIPLVKEETILKMKNTILNSKNDKTWVVPECKNEEGHPVLISSSLIPEILHWNGEFGLQGFLTSQNSNKIIEYVDDEGTIFDIDDQDDFINFKTIISV
jgi:CTP:molybdopterin cytidylyltransferase MocA